MNSLAIYNIALGIIVLLILLKVFLPYEKSGMLGLNKNFQEIKNNQQCLSFLQKVTIIPIWRFALLSSAIFTVIITIIVCIAGYCPSQPIHYLGIWAFFLLLFVFSYQIISFRNYHYICEDNCLGERMSSSLAGKQGP